MLCKKPDDKQAAVAVLENLLARAGSNKKAAIERELHIMRAGIKGEREAAYLIDFHLKDSRKTAVLHDLRLQLDDGRVAQIDHLLIHQTYRFYVLETKHFSHGVKITDEGEFLRWNDWKKTYEGMPSPIEQNERHVLVLKKALAMMGLPEPAVESMILVAPQARIDRSKKFNSSMVIKADQFLTAYQKNLDSANVLSMISGLVRTTFSESLVDISRKLLRMHRPILVDYEAKFGMRQDHALPLPALEQGPISIEFGNTPAVTAVAPVSEPASTAVALSVETTVHACKKCRSAKLSIQYGKFGYYFKCSDCDANAPAKVACGKDGHRERLRKDGKRFYRECQDCASSSLYFVNQD
ncbi:nuclease-related domain-containing protein [Noviherbaspirillum pedocola]|uniref:NERD domain-containing protein n=1 Tax=Noviherbaspirillum pedocola TaxID=2801341 RepID=A0A934SW56_9BURK|nr:NERD domain-containing protein [Noviherbaspirillum pedocola]MBK4736503.1 NERD domain-containing protein [Noviherbaspirillum pedocola]